MFQPPGAAVVETMSSCARRRVSAFHWNSDVTTSTIAATTPMKTSVVRLCNIKKIKI